MLLDSLDHQRLRVRGLIALVVTVAPVADEVDDDVVAEATAEGKREPDRRDRGFGIVRVHVDDRRRKPRRGRSEKRVERLSAGSVVNPTWLFAITWSVPPVE